VPAFAAAVKHQYGSRQYQRPLYLLITGVVQKVSQILHQLTVQQQEPQVVKLAVLLLLIGGISCLNDGSTVLPGLLWVMDQAQGRRLVTIAVKLFHACRTDLQLVRTKPAVYYGILGGSIRPCSITS
jgi:hypothetical protein